MFHFNARGLVTQLQKHFYNVVFYVLIVSAFYYSFWLFFDLVERQINTEMLSSVLLHLATCLTLSLPFFWVKRKKEISLYILFFIDLYLIANLLYYRTYFTILPLDSYTMCVNFGGLGSSIISAIHASDILFLIPTLILVLLYIFFFQRRLVVESLKLRSIASGIIILTVSGIIGVNLYVDRNEVSNMLSDENEFKYDVVEGASTYGFLHCWDWQLWSVFEVNNKLIAVEKNKINGWLGSRKQDETSLNPVDNSGKNLILVIVESFESFPIGKKLNGQEITPHLNKILKTQSCFYASNIVPQVNIGHSSDTQLIFNTGMLPPHAGAACFRFQNNTYFTLAKALGNKGYRSHTLLGGNGSFWNQGVMNKTFGYDELISIDQFNDDESYDFGLTDSTFLAQSADKLNKFKQPFLAQLITLSSHDPYVLLNNRIYFQTPKDCPLEMARYLNAIHYVDQCLGRFIDELHKNGLFDKSIVLISGDHDATKQHPKQWISYAQKQWKTKIGFTPLIILNGTTKQVYKPVIGQIDVYPTLIELMNLKNYNWHGLGQSIFSKGKAGFAVNARYEEFGDSTTGSESEIQQIRTAWDISDLMIRKNYFAN
jgi:lipoteichoic acid synthase